MRLSAWWRVAVSLAGVKLATCHYSDDDIDFTDAYDDEVLETSPAHEVLTRVRRFDGKEVEDMLKQIFQDREIFFPTRLTIPKFSKMNHKDVTTRDGSSKLTRHLEDTEYPTADVEDIILTMRTSQTAAHQPFREDNLVTIMEISKNTIATDKDEATDESSTKLTSNNHEDTEYPTSDVEDIMRRIRTSQIEDPQILKETSTLGQVITLHDVKGTELMYEDNATQESSETSSEFEFTDNPKINTEEIELNMRANQIKRPETLELQGTEDRLAVSESNMMTILEISESTSENLKDDVTQESTTELTSSSHEDTDYSMNDVEDLLLKIKTSQVDYPQDLREKPAVDQYTETRGKDEGNKRNHEIKDRQSLRQPPESAVPDYSLLVNTTVMGKCFVCGLDTLRVPQFAHCADAFAGDFLPLTPVDTRAKGHIAKFRKYCRYRDIDHYTMNASLPRSIFGRWTGGCSVRWIDLSGIYTQRSCRNKDHPVLGMHYGSKRMAKLELALTGLDNGCIVSPMATLVPFSRGISLFARFHACVCTGSWCNGCDVHHPCMLPLPLLLYSFFKYLIS